MKGLTDIPGIRVGHVSDFEAITGCTAILCEKGAMGGVDIRGFASGTQEIDTLSPSHVSDQVHGILLSGGSAFGLEAAAGVRRYLAGRGVGLAFGGQHVPIVPAAILFDLGIAKPNVHPNAAMGEAAAAAATADAVKEGCVGAGTGATVGKILGMKQCMKGGIGSFTVTLPGGVMVSSLVAVNAVGDVRDPGTGKIVAGARKAPDSREFVNTVEHMKRGGAAGGGTPRNTTLGVVATNAKLNKVQTNMLAHFASLGMARAIYPVNTTFDGDIVFALSLGEQQADINVLGVAAAEALAEAILRAVKMATTLGGVPGLA
ncbi:MAG TPA: P1 family peptidase [Candidatus Acidoferrales bacterium]|jgi:L-aminopeptidase/D-esterase-like protein|nr:P1 family peptidase [Candidatus Acidoferrales bacterium]